MKKLSLVLCATMLAGIGSKAMAQVQDVSFTVAPVVGYTHWDSKLNLGVSPSRWSTSGRALASMNPWTKAG